MNLDAKKSVSADGISAMLLKMSAPVIAQEVTKLIKKAILLLVKVGPQNGKAAISLLSTKKMMKV